MNRRTLLGRFVAPSLGTKSAERPKYFRTLIEPLETRQLLSVTTLNWTVDQSVSKLTIGLPDTTATANISGTSYHLTARLRDQSGSGSSGTWSTGNSAVISGTVAIDYVDGGSLQFMTGQSNLGEVDTVSWRPTPGIAVPNPGYNIPADPLSAYPNLYSNYTYTPNKSDGEGTFINNTSAPAAFGTRLNATITYPLVVFGFTANVPVTADAGYLSLSQISNDVDSPVLPISAGSFPANTTNIGISGGQADLQGFNIVGLFTVPSYNLSAAGFFSSATNSAASGTITNTGTLTRKLTLPVSIPISYPLPTDIGSVSINGTISGTIVANVTLTAPTVDLNGTDPGTGFTNTWSGTPVNIGGTTPPTNALIYTDTLNMAATGGVQVSMATFHTGDVLAANTTGTSITASYAGGTLTLSGTDTTANYEQVLDTVTYNNTAGGPGVLPVTVKVFATDSLGLTSAESDATINIAVLNTPPTVDLNGAGAGTGFTSTWNGVSPVVITDAANATVMDDGSLASMTVTLASPATGDVLAANTTGTSITAVYAAGVLTLTGVDTPADYQQVLRTVTYNNTAGGPGVSTESATVLAIDNGPGAPLPSNMATATININTAPTVDLNGAAAGTGFTSTWNGVSPVVITDAANATVTDNGTTLASMTVTLTGPHTGDVLAANTTGTSITQGFANGTLTLSGVDTLADYQTVLRTVTYNNTSGGPGVAVETAAVVANDGSLNSTPVTATININTAPTVDLNGAAAGTSYTASWSGSSAVAITDAANATVTDNGTTLASMTVTLTGSHTGDVLAANTTGTSITQGFAGGVLTLSGVDTLADYQQVLRTVTYNNTSGGPGVAVETATVVANDGFLNSTAVTSTINMPAPSLSLTAGSGSGAPNYTTTWYNQGTIPTENNVLATVTALSGVTTLSSLKVTLATFHTGDVLSLAPLGGVSLTLTSSYSAGTLTLSGTDSVGHYQQALRFINYNNTVGGPGATPIVATFVANDGTHASNPVTSTININVGSGQVLGNRLFYNNSKYDGNNGNIAATDDNAIASDKTGYTGTGTATFANVSSFNKGITGIMVDLQSGLGTHTAITAGDISFKVSPTTFVTTTYNQLSTWSAGPTPAAVSVRIGAGQGGSDRLEITFGTGVVKNEWLEVNVHSGGNTGLSANDVFYFGSIIGDSGAADTVLLAKTDANDYNVPFNNIIGLTTPVWNLADYTKDGKVDGSDASTAIGNIFSLHYLANPTGPFAPNGGGSAAPAASPAATPTASASGAVSSGLSILNSGSINVPTWLSGRLQSILTSPPVTKAIQTALHNPQILNAVEQVASKLQLNEDVLDGLLKDLGI